MESIFFSVAITTPFVAANSCSRDHIKQSNTHAHTHTLIPRNLNIKEQTCNPQRGGTFAHSLKGVLYLEKLARRTESCQTKPDLGEGNNWSKKQLVFSKLILRVLSFSHDACQSESRPVICKNICFTKKTMAPIIIIISAITQ
jgi:hypothetical protein